jgi:ABC-type nickel/cobalt efflux system permease component RcnA
MNALLTAATADGLTLAVDPAKVKPGWLALVIVLLLCLATFLLWRSMNRQLRKVDFDDGSTEEAAREQPAHDGAARDGSAAGATPDEGSVPDGNGGASRP